MRGVGGDHPDGVGLGESLRLLTELVTLRMLAVKIEPLGGDETKDFRNDRPSQAQGTEQDGLRFAADQYGEAGHARNLQSEGIVAGRGDISLR